MASATETQAKRIRTQVKTILADKGLTITRIRPPKEDDLEEQVETIKGFIDPQQKSDSTQFAEVGGLTIDQADVHQVLVDGFTSVIEGDLLVFSNQRWRVVRLDYTYLGDTTICLTATVRRIASDEWDN